jgi:hypothetical protein
MLASFSLLPAPHFGCITLLLSGLCLARSGGPPCFVRSIHLIE